MSSWKSQFNLCRYLKFINQHFTFYFQFQQVLRVQRVRNQTSVTRALPSHYHYTSSLQMFPDFTSTSLFPGISTHHHPGQSLREGTDPVSFPAWRMGSLGWEITLHSPKPRDLHPQPPMGINIPAPAPAVFLLTLHFFLHSSQPGMPLLSWSMSWHSGKERHQIHPSAKRVQKGQHPQAALEAPERTREHRIAKSSSASIPLAEPAAGRGTSDPAAPPSSAAWRLSAACEGPPAPHSGSQGVQAGLQQGGHGIQRTAGKSSVLLLLHTVFQANHATPERRGERDG